MSALLPFICMDATCCCSNVRTCAISTGDSGRTHCKYIIDRRSLIRDIVREQTESTQAILRFFPSFPTTSIPIYIYGGTWSKWFERKRRKKENWNLIKTRRSCYKIKTIVGGLIDVLQSLPLPILVKSRLPSISFASVPDRNKKASYLNYCIRVLPFVAFSNYRRGSLLCLYSK